MQSIMSSFSRVSYCVQLVKCKFKCERELSEQLSFEVTKLRESRVLKYYSENK